MAGSGLFPRQHGPLVVVFFIIPLTVIIWRSDQSVAFASCKSTTTTLYPSRRIRPTGSLSYNCPLLLFNNKRNKEQDDANDNGAETGQFRQQRWDEKIAQLIRYNATFGTVNVPYTHRLNGDKYASLSGFVGDIKKRQGRLSKERHNQLTAIGFTWEGAQEEKRDQQWEEMYDRLVKYNATHGDCKVPTKWVDSDGVRLGKWVARQRHVNNNGFIREDRKAKLDSIGFVWILRAHQPHTSLLLDEKWEQKRQELIQYHKENGEYWVPLDRKNRKNPLNPLGYWAETQRKMCKDGTLRPDREELLNEIGFTWDAKEKLDTQWQAKFNKLKQVLEKRKRSHDRENAKVFTPAVLGKSLYNWAEKQRMMHENNTLDAKRKQLLDNIGFEWTQVSGKQ